MRGRAEATAFAPASVANVAVGFDILGHTIEGPGDRVTVRWVEGGAGSSSSSSERAEPPVRIAAIRGVVTGLPTDPTLNTAGRALLALHRALSLPFGFEVEIDKGIPLASGLGGSAASAVAALVAANALLEAPLSREQLYAHALEAEAQASGAPHGDNVGPQLIGGLVLAARDRLVPIPVPPGLVAVVVHPHLTLETRSAREVLKTSFALGEFVAQSEHLALVLAGCFRNDLALIRAGLSDGLVEPRRAPLIPGFARVKEAALDQGAMGASISGAGPSVFAWFEAGSDAMRAGEAMRRAFAAAGLESDVLVSPVAGPRAEVVE